MAFVLNIFRGEKKDSLGFLPRGAKPVDKKAKKNDLEDIADEFMRKEEYNVQADKYGVSLEPSSTELAEDVPHEDDDDRYYTPLEKQLYQRPRPQSNVVHSSPIRWQKGGVLGVGAFGKVFMGLNLDTGELIAVKQISLEGQHRREVEAVEHEVNLLRNLRHENIVQYFGTSVEENTLNIFLEYVPGGSIASLLQKFGKFSEPVIQVYTKQLLLGLEYLHRHQIVHRDIKGANILVDNSGTIKLADFGASKTIEGFKNRNLTMSGIKGTPLWMAPEVIKQVRHGRQADIWSVGCTVIEMATGQPPWCEFTDQVSALFHIGSSNDIPRIPEWLSAEGKDFLLSCLKRDPKKRPTAIKLLEHSFVAKSNLPSERSPASSEASSRASYSPGLSRQLSRDSLTLSLTDSPKNLTLRPSKATGSEPNSGSSTPARRLTRGVSSSNGSPRDSPSGTLRGRHNLSSSQLQSDDTCDDEPVAVKR